MRSYRVSLLIILSLVAVLIGGITVLRYQEFTEQHQAIARESVRGVTAELARFIDDRKRLVGVFTEVHQARLESLVHQPEDMALYRALDAQVARYFPDYYVYAITDPQGVLLVHDYNFLVGEMCLEDIRDFNVAGLQKPRVHPSMDEHHFDLLGEFRVNGKDHILLISFNARILGDMLEHMETPDHQLLLVLDDGELLLEASAEGSRRDFYRLDYRLAPEEQARVLAARPIPGTRWRALDLHAPGLFGDMRRRLLVEGVAVFALFALLSGVMALFLGRAERRRREAEQMKDEFLSVVSHELRTPITSMLGSLGLLANDVAGELPNRAKELVHVALANGERLLALVNDILDIQRIETTRLAIERRPLVLADLVRESLEHNRPYAERFGTRFVLHDGAPGAEVLGDSQRLMQVLDNLLSNAAKYGREGDVVEVRLDAADARVRVSIRDHGPGVAPELRARIFDKFTQGDASPRRRRDGTGLGLFIARNLVEQHAGRIGFESTPGEGSCFWFELPLASSAARQSAARPLD